MSSDRTRSDDTDTSRDLRALGEALGARCDDVVTKQRSLCGFAEFTPYHHVQSGAAVRSFVLWLTTGETAQTDDMDTILETGGQQIANEEISVGLGTRMCFAWRDAVISVLREEAERLDISPNVLDRAVAAARTSNDAFVVLLGDRFDAQRAKLQAALDERTKELARRAFHDPLTGLANRAQFFEKLELDCAPSTPEERRCAVVYMDLDGFKAVNDTFGHQVGDQILVSAAERLRRVVRPGDLVSRIGGDEFVVLCSSADDDVVEVADGIARRIREALANPFYVSGQFVSVRASVGIAVKAPGRTSAEHLLASADAAMYEQKRHDRAERVVAR